MLLEHLDLGFTNVQGWRLWSIVVRDLLVLFERLVNLTSQVKSSVKVSRAQPEVFEASYITDLVEDYVRV